MADDEGALREVSWLANMVPMNLKKTEQVRYENVPGEESDLKSRVS